MFNSFSKGLVGLALLASLSGGAALAQAPIAPQAPPMAASQHHQRFAALNLTDAQRAQIHTIMQAARAERRANRENFESELKTVLTQDQWSRYQAHKADMRQRREAWKSNPQAAQQARLAWQQQHPGAHGHRHHRGSWLVRNLHLSPEQQAQLQAYREAQGPVRRREHQQVASQIRNILTPAQQLQWDQMHQHHHQA